MPSRRWHRRATSCSLVGIEFEARHDRCGSLDEQRHRRVLGRGAGHQRAVQDPGLRAAVRRRAARPRLATAGCWWRGCAGEVRLAAVRRQGRRPARARVRSCRGRPASAGRATCWDKRSIGSPWPKPTARALRRSRCASRSGSLRSASSTTQAPSAKARRSLARDLQHQPGLADSPRADQRHQVGPSTAAASPRRCRPCARRNSSVLQADFRRDVAADRVCTRHTVVPIASPICTA